MSSEWEKLGGLNVPLKFGYGFTVSRSFMEEVRVQQDMMARLQEQMLEEMSYAFGGQPVPFDRQLHWHGCHRWSAPRVTSDPATEVAEARYPRPEHWDDSIPGFFADWADDLGEWPRSRLYDAD